MSLHTARGHFRSLDGALLSELRSLAGRDRVAVVTSGHAQLRRIQEMLLEGADVIAGFEFFPGLPPLARRLLPEGAVEPAQPGTLDRILAVREASMGLPPGAPFRDASEDPAGALSMSGLLEDLLDKGVGWDELDALIKSGTVGSDPVTLAISSLLRSYQAIRERLCPNTRDRILARASRGCETGRFEAYVFYGIYDLNPLQRRFVSRLLRSGARAMWLSPLTPHTAESLGIAARTEELLSAGAGSRPDSRIPPPPFAPYVEQLVISGSRGSPPEGLAVISADGTPGLARAVERFIAQGRGDGVHPSEMAIVGRKSVIAPVVRMLACEGVPLDAGRTAGLSSLPSGAFLTAVATALGKDCHYLYLIRAVETGALRAEYCPPADEIRAFVEETGLRGGLHRHASRASRAPRLAAFLDLLERFEDALGPVPVPARDLPAALGILGEALEPSLAGQLEGEEGLVDPAWDGGVPAPALLEAVCVALGSAVIGYGAGDPAGVRVIDFEDARGMRARRTMVIGLEEGVLPSGRLEDPRLPASVRSRFELPDAPTREAEEAFLLVLAADTASERLTLAFRRTDDSGKPVSHSHLIDPLLRQDEEREDPPWFSAEPSDPLRSVFGGPHPGQQAVRAAERGDLDWSRPFLSQSFSAVLARRGAGPLGRHDGVIGRAGRRAPDPHVSPTGLSDWARCPFRYLARRKWGLEEAREPSIASGPDPASFGSLLHRAMEKLLGEGPGFAASSTEVRVVVEEVACEEHLEERLGRSEFVEAFVDGSCRLIRAALERLAATGWEPAETEVCLEGALGGIFVKGKCDLVLDSDSGPVVIDFKTGRPGRKSKLLGEISMGREYQIPLYALLMAGAGRAPAAGGYFYLRNSTVVLLDREELGVLGSAALAMAERVSALQAEGVYAPVIRKEACRGCDLAHLCRRDGIYLARASADSRVSWLAGGEDDAPGGPGEGGDA